MAIETRKAQLKCRGLYNPERRRKLAPDLNMSPIVYIRLTHLTL